MLVSAGGGGGDMFLVIFIWVSRLPVLVWPRVPLAMVTLAFFTAFPLSSLHGALQAAVFYMIAGMAFAAFFRSEITGAMATAVLLAFNGLVTGFGNNQIRISPFFNPLGIRNRDATELFAWTLQNRILFVLLIVAITLLTFARVERREKMLGN